MKPTSVARAVATAFRETLDPDDRRRHMLDTYFWLRRFVSWIGFLLPVVLLLVGWLAYDDVRNSMSAYYYTTVRGIFVGSLFAVAALLFAYKGFSDAEDTVLDVAAVLLVCVAVFPTDAPDCQENCGGLSLHGAVAVGFFVSIAVVVLRYSSITLELMQDQRRRERFRKTYRTLGSAMLVLPLIAWLLHTFKMNETVFVVEALGVWVFSYYWQVKSRELKQTDGDAKVIEGTPLPSPGDAAQLAAPPAAR